MKVAVFQLSLFGINMYVVYDPQSCDCAVIDPGITTDREREALVSFIEREHLNVVHVINTHMHIDHVAGNAFVQKKYDADVLAHQDDVPLGDRVGEQAKMFGLLGSYEDVKVTRYLKDGDVIRIGDGTLKVIHVPGHSPGHIALYDGKDGYLIAGDILFCGSIGRTDLPGGNHQQLINGIKEKLLPLPDNTIVYPGHGPATTIGDERLTNPFLL